MKKIIVLATVIVAAFAATAQNNVGINTTTPNASAALDITATNKGLLIPRVTTAARIGITVPAKGLMVYDSTVNNFYYYTGAAWKIMDTLPEKAGNSGKYLTTDGTGTKWAAAAGTGAAYELFVTKTPAQAQTTAVGDPNALPDVITFSNISADQANAPLTLTSPYLTAAGNTWNGANGRFTCATPGLYQVSIQFTEAQSNASYVVPMLDMNGTGYSASSIYGLGAYSNTASGIYKGRGNLNTIMYLNAGDYFIVRGLSNTTVIGVKPGTDGSSFIKIVKLK